MAKAKKQVLSLEERLESALVPEGEQTYSVPKNWVWTYLTTGFAKCMDQYRKPINARERSLRAGDIPYYGATGQVGWIDNFLTDEQLVLVGEDGAPFLEYGKDKAYIIAGKAWVNNHAHILRSFYGEFGNIYLCHYLNCFNYKGYVNGTTRLKLTQASLNTIPIPLPPLAEQQRIVTQIEGLFQKLDNARDLVQNALDSFETRKAAIFHKAFSGELTARWRKSNDILLESWENINLGKYVETQYGYTESSSNEPVGPKFLRITDIQNQNVDWKNVPYCQISNENYLKYRLHCGNIVVARTGATTGKSYLIQEDVESIFASYLVRIIIKNREKLHESFLYKFMQSSSYWNQISTLSHGIAQPGVNANKLKGIIIPVPSIQEQQEIVRILDNLLEAEQKAKDLCDVLDQIDLMKKSILARAFRGELGTNDPNEESALELLKEVLSETVSGVKA